MAIVGSVGKGGTSAKSTNTSNNIFSSIKKALSTPSASTIAANTAKVANTSKATNTTSKATTTNTSNRNGVTSTVAQPSATTYTSQNVQNYIKNLNTTNTNKTTTGNTNVSALATGKTTVPPNTALTDRLNAQQGLAAAKADATANGYNGANTKIINTNSGGKTGLGDIYNTGGSGVPVYATTGTNGTYINTVGTDASGKTVGASVDELPTYSTLKEVYENYVDANSDPGANEDPNYVNYNNGGNGDSGSDTVVQNDYYNDLLAAFMESNEQARQAAIDAIIQNLDSVKGTYKTQIQKVIDEYNQLVNENEVKKDRARRVIRENQANRGQLDSGMGRQELLDMNIGYDNQTMAINLAKEQAVNEIYNLIAQAEAEANTNKANVNNTYNNALLEYQLAQQ